MKDTTTNSEQVLKAAASLLTAAWGKIVVYLLALLPAGIGLLASRLDSQVLGIALGISSLALLTLAVCSLVLLGRSKKKISALEGDVATLRQSLRDRSTVVVPARRGGWIFGYDR